MISTNVVGKLGKDFASFNMSPVHTCPGSTKICEKCCFGTRGNFLYPTPLETHYRNYQASHDEDFVRKIVIEIRRNFVRNFRIHVVGDFYSVEYIRKWIAIVKQLPRTQFLAYTRSWRIRELRRELNKLAALPNMVLWASTDKETGRPPKTLKWPIAYMAADYDDVPSFPVNLIFRVKRHRPQKYAQSKFGPILICPAEQGIKRQVHITCSTCRLCLNPTHPCLRPKETQP